MEANGIEWCRRFTQASYKYKIRLCCIDINYVMVFLIFIEDYFEAKKKKIYSL